MLLFTIPLTIWSPGKTLEVRKKIRENENFKIMATLIIFKTTYGLEIKSEKVEMLLYKIWLVKKSR